MHESLTQHADIPPAHHLQKVCIVGAGAIGSLLGARLAATGRVSVSALARGETLQALRQHGWRLQGDDGEFIGAPVQASDRAQDLGLQDVVIVAVKGPALTGLSASSQPLLGPDTLILPAMNGVPWWFCQGLQGFEAGLPSVDRSGAIAQRLPFSQLLGCVVHASGAVLEPGLVRHIKGRQLIIGEPSGGVSSRASALAQLLQFAGFDARVSDNVRRDIWFKLWGNLTMNPLSAVTGATVDRILADPLLRQFCSSAMDEVARVGAAIGCEIEQSPEDRHALTAQLGAFKTSMLQDVESGKPLELDAIVAAVCDIAQGVGVQTPHIDALFGISRLFARTKGLYPHE
ncbi:2-dehydropantoate 2-reductase [Curvibacter sp. RS43]|uniref:ketopantoate reductase family protein n=1 Tax=Curvibacter microcysteis TaxID=3026419 RepID=UPI00235F182D|nr:2-dehydropantoate 2-reductase [Curvibacter sp. RS43]MDD0812714.1 2-dehydropantoate 2-reductase [Curvibacter sp. RS43]